MSTLRSRNGSCTVERALHRRQTTRQKAQTQLRDNSHDTDTTDRQLTSLHIPALNDF